MSNFLWPRGLQHVRLLCPSLSLRVCSNLCPLSQWSNHLFCLPLLLPSIFPSIKVFSNESVLRIRWPMYWSFSFSISPSNEHSRLISFRMTGLISLQSKGLSRVFSNTTAQKVNSSVLSFLYDPILTSIHDYWKKQLWLDGPLLAK